MGNVTSYFDTGLTTLALYSYTVQACDAAGNCSGKSASVSVSTSAPTNFVTSYGFVGSSTFQIIGNLVYMTIDRVTNYSRSTTSGSLRIELWALSAPYSYPNSVSGYRVAAIRTVNITNGSDVLAPNSSFSGINLTLAYTAPPAGYTYYTLFLDQYDSISCNSADYFCFVAYLNFSPISDTDAPTVPTGVTATSVSASQITLNWAASTDNLGVTSYKVYRGGLLIATLGNVTSYVDNSGLAGGTRYLYAVQACDVVGNCSAQSQWASGTTQQIISTNANLSTLTYGTGTLSPSFSSSITSYTLALPASTTSVAYFVQASDARSTLTYSGTPTSFIGSVSLPSAAGTFEVTAPDGITKKRYVVTYVLPASATDAVPDAFSFSPRTGITPGSVAESSAITVSGINSPSTISIVGGQYAINGGTYTSAAGTVSSLNTVKVRVTAPNGYGQTGSATLTIGGVSGAFTVTTVPTRSNPNDCLFDWAERTFSQFFAPAAAASSTAAPYYYRYYAGTRNFLAVSAADNHIWVLGPMSGNVPLDVAPAATYLATAGCQ